MAFPEHRIVERRLRAAKRNIQSCWKLYTTGSVGGQALVGLPALHRLRTDHSLGARCRIWPFETGWAATLSDIVIVEIWPSLHPDMPERHPVKDARQVIAACEWLVRAQREPGGVARLLGRPDGLSDIESAVVLAEEGWVLGVGTGLA